MLADQRTHAMPLGRVIARGFAAAHGALLGALLLFLLHAPAQVLNALTPGLQAEAMPAPGKQPDPSQVIVYLAVACGSLLLGVGVFFLFPLMQGGILGQVRDRLESPEQPPGRLGAYGREFYLRLLGSQGLFLLVMLTLMVPVMCLSMSLAFQEMARFAQNAAVDGAPSPQPPHTQQLTRRLMTHPGMLAGMAIAMILAGAMGMVYWVANCIVVSEREPVIASWGKAIHFCRRNLAAVLVVALIPFAVGILTSPAGLVGPMGIVMELWALVGLALLQSALIAYWGVLLPGLVMSLYLARRPVLEQPGPVARVAPGSFQQPRV
jgi:hypothetical protein